MQESLETPPSRRGKLFAKFSLRTLFVAMTFLAISIGLFVKSVQDRVHAIEAIKYLNGSISYKLDGPRWLGLVVKDERYFWRPVAVRFNPNKPLSDADLAAAMEYMLQFEQLAYINLNRSAVSNDGLAALLPLAERLESLDVSGTRIDDGGIDTVAKLLRLKLLRINNASFTEEGVERIREALPRCQVVE